MKSLIQKINESTNKTAFIGKDFPECGKIRQCMWLNNDVFYVLCSDSKGTVNEILFNENSKTFNACNIGISDMKKTEFDLSEEQLDFVKKMIMVVKKSDF